MCYKVINSFIRPPFLLVVLFYFLLSVVQSSNECGTCIENEKLQQTELIEKFDMLQAEMKTEINQLKSENEELKAELKSQKTEINQLKSRNIEFKSEVEEMRAKLSQQDQKILQLEMSKMPEPKIFDPPEPTDSYTTMTENVPTKKNKKSASLRASLGLLPRSCDGLRKEGHFADGIYLVLNEDINKIDAVLCQFPGAKQVVQEAIGTVDVRTKTVHFYVQRNSYFGTEDAVIPFELAPLNEGDAFDLPSGIFTAPVAGIYHFDFSALKYYESYILNIFLQVNGVKIGAAHTGHVAGNEDVVSLSASLRLAEGDKVNMFNDGNGVLIENDDRLTHFTGWLVEQDLM